MILFEICIGSESEATSGMAPLLARDTDYCALVGGANMFWHCATDTQRPLNETTKLIAADLVRFALL